MGRKRKELPPGFRELFPVMKNRELAEKFGVSKKNIGDWGRKAGIKKAYPTNLYGTNYKRVLQTGVDGEPIAIYNNTKEAARAMGRRFGYILIREVCRGVRPLAYGCRWSYVHVALDNEEVTTDNQD